MNCPSCTDPDCRGEQMHVPGSVGPRVETPRSDGRRALDDYPTPDWVIRAIAFHVAGARVLDPCCGAGAVLDVFAERGCVVSGIELSPERADEARAKRHEVVTADALAVEWPQADLIITNPPYSHAQEFAEKAIASVAPGGTVALLLRLGFLAGKKRLGFHRANGSSVYVLSSRPSFVKSVSCSWKPKCGWHVMLDLDADPPKSCEGCGGSVSVNTTDSSEYGWFLWGAKNSRSLHFLDAADPNRRPRTIVAAAPELRPIPGAQGFLASADGKIYTTRRRIRDGRSVSFAFDGEPKELSAYDRKSVKGEPTVYRSVMIWWDGGKRKPAYVHHLVALAFLGPRPEGAEVLHGAKGSSCNAADNLRYGTPDENGAERAHPRDDEWYRKRGMCPPRFKERHEIEAEHAAAGPVAEEPRGAFDDLLEVAQ